MHKSFFSILFIITVIFITLSIANAQNFTDGDLIHMRDDSDTLTEDNLVEIENTSSVTSLNLFFRVSIEEDVAADTQINVTPLVPTNQTAPTPTFHYKNGNSWTTLQTSTNSGTVSITYNVLEGIATALSAANVEVRASFTTVPTSRFQVELHTTSLDRVYFDCSTGTASHSVYDVTDDGLINNADITAVSQAITDNSLTGDVSEDGRINYVDFDLVTFAVAQGFSIPTNSAPAIGDTLPDVEVWNSFTHEVYAHLHFSDPDGDALTYAATTSDSTIASVDVGGVGNSTVYIYANALGTATITVIVTDTNDATTTQTFTATVVQRPPTAVGTIPDQTVNIGGTAATVDVSSYFSGPDGGPLTYTASSSDTTIATVSVSNATVTITGVIARTTTITVTATASNGLTATQTFSVTVEELEETTQPSSADAIPGLSSEEQLQLGALLTYDTLIFNELHNGSDDTTDWLELRNVSGTELPLDNWHLTIHTGDSQTLVPFPAGTVIPAGEVLLITNTAWEVARRSSRLQEESEMATADLAVAPVVVETFALPQTDFALILRSPTVFSDLTGNYFEGEGERRETAPALTVDTVWARTQPIGFGYRDEAWAASTSEDGLGTPGYLHPVPSLDLNSDGVVNILDLVLVAGQIGQPASGNPADLNGDGTVDILDLMRVVEAFSP